MPSAAVTAAMAPALARVRSLQAQPLGVVLDSPIGRQGRSRVGARQSVRGRASGRDGRRHRVQQQFARRLARRSSGGAADVRPLLRRVSVRQSLADRARDRRRADAELDRRGATRPAWCARALRGSCARQLPGRQARRRAAPPERSADSPRRGADRGGDRYAGATRRPRYGGERRRDRRAGGRAGDARAGRRLAPSPRPSSRRPSSSARARWEYAEPNPASCGTQ